MLLSYLLFVTVVMGCSTTKSANSCLYGRSRDLIDTTCVYNINKFLSFGDDCDINKKRMDLYYAATVANNVSLYLMSKDNYKNYIYGGINTCYDEICVDFLDEQKTLDLQMVWMDRPDLVIVFENKDTTVAYVQINVGFYTNEIQCFYFDDDCSECISKCDSWCPSKNQCYNSTDDIKFCTDFVNQCQIPPTPNNFIGIIIGVVVGFIALSTIVIVVTIILIRRRSKRSERVAHLEQVELANNEAFNPEYKSDQK